MSLLLPNQWRPKGKLETLTLEKLDLNQIFPQCSQSIYDFFKYKSLSLLSRREKGKKRRERKKGNESNQKGRKEGEKEKLNVKPVGWVHPYLAISLLLPHFRDEETKFPRGYITS